MIYNRYGNYLRLHLRSRLRSFSHRFNNNTKLVRETTGQSQEDSSIDNLRIDYQQIFRHGENSWNNYDLGSDDYLSLSIYIIEKCLCVTIE